MLYQYLLNLACAASCVALSIIIDKKNSSIYLFYPGHHNPSSGKLRELKAKRMERRKRRFEQLDKVEPPYLLCYPQARTLSPISFSLKILKDMER